MRIAKASERAARAESRIGLHTQSSVPEGRREQQLAALGKANEIRLGRAQLKRDLAAGRLDMEEILTRLPEVAKTARVRDLLLAIPGLGPARITRLQVCCGISESKTAAALSERQRGELIRRLAR
jgi:hypothetical protein